MTPMIRRSVAAAASAALLTFTMAGVIPTTAAQDAGATKTKTKAKAKEKDKAAAPAAKVEQPPVKAARTPPDPTHRVPAYFGSLGLSDEQKERIYAVEGKYLPQIQELQKKVEGLRERMMADCEDVLTPAQKKVLSEARKTAADRRKAAAKSKDDDAE